MLKVFFQILSDVIALLSFLEIKCLWKMERNIPRKRTGKLWVVVFLSFRNELRGKKSTYTKFAKGEGVAGKASTLYCTLLLNQFHLYHFPKFPKFRPSSPLKNMPKNPPPPINFFACEKNSWHLTIIAMVVGTFRGSEGRRKGES